MSVGENMKQSIGIVALSATLAFVAGCSSLPVAHQHANTVSHRYNPESGEHEFVRADQPSEAQQFMIAQRVPNNAKTLDMQRYVAARQHADQMPWFSVAGGHTISAASPTQLAALNTWQELGPGNVGGRTRVLRFQPGNPSTMFVAGVDGGLWKSTDAGASWNPLTDLAPNLAIVSMVIDSSNPLRMWVGTGEGVFNGDAIRGAGIFFSSDGGISWNQQAATANSGFYFVNDMVQSPNSPNTLYAATGTGLYRTTNSGITWSLVIDTSTSGVSLFGGCFSVKAKPGGATDTVLASCGTFGGNGDFSAFANGAVFRNTDASGAGIWTSVLSVANQGRATLAIAPSDPTTMYALIATGDQINTRYADGLRGVYQSTNSGANWTAKVQSLASSNLNNNLLLSNPVEARLVECGFDVSNAFFNQGWYDNIITVDPLNASRVWVGGIDLWRSDDAGANWGVASYWWFPPTDPNYAHADNHSITFHPGYNGTSNQKLYVTSDGGIFRSDNAAAAVGTDTTTGGNNSICGNVNLPAVHWANLNNGYGVTQFYDGAVYPDNATYFGGTQDNGTNRGTDGAGPNAWKQLLGGDGGYVAVDASNPLKIYGEFTGISMERSTDGGVNFSGGTTGISDGGLFINPFIIDANNPSRLWTGGAKLWRTNNSMVSWTQAYNVVLSGLQFSAFAVAPNLPDLLLAGTDNGQVYKLTGATTATSATATPAFVLPRSQNGAYVSSFAFDPTQNGADTTKRTVIETSSSFNNEGATPQEAHVLKSTNSGATWTGIDGMTAAGPSPNGLPDIPVNTAVIDPTTANAQRIYVGTDIGVFVTVDGGASWTRENTGFANVSVRKLLIQLNPTTKQYELFAFTHGRGTFKTVVQRGDFIFANGFD
jgi:hypothetical protein